MPTGEWTTKDAIRDPATGRIIGRKAKEMFEETPSEELPVQETGGSVQEMAESASASGLETSADGPKTVKAGIERELTVIGPCANPKLIRCFYFELASRRTCLVNVKRNAKWIKGMRFRMIEPADEEAYKRPWVYEGKPPRLRGRW